MREVLPDDAEDLPVVGIQARACYFVGHVWSIFPGWALAFQVYGCVAGLQGHVDQEARVSRIAKPDCGLVTVPVRHLGEVVIAEVAPEAAHEPGEIGCLRRGGHDDECARLLATPETGLLRG